MDRRIALKRLTKSDLTFFSWQFRNRNAGNQKSINLNADVFVSHLYPGLGAVGADTEIPLPLGLYGPSGKPLYRVVRKVLKGETYKNWRLNGEFVNNPDEDPERFNVLKEGDLAVMQFHGDERPRAVDLLFLASGRREDAALYAAFSALLPAGVRRSMVVLSEEQVSAAAGSAGIPQEHPLRLFWSDPAFEAAMEDAAAGSAEGLESVRRLRRGRKITSAELARARQKAEAVGRDGEAVVHGHLLRELSAGRLTKVEWTSSEDPCAPYDFEIEMPGGVIIRIDAKSTEADFTRKFHISEAEIACAASSAERYDIYRVYGLNENGAKLRTAEGIRDFAGSLMTASRSLPAGVTPDGFLVDPRGCGLFWEAELDLPRPEEPEGE